MLLSSAGITLIYLAFLIIGVIYAVIVLIGAELGNLHIPGLDFHVGGHDFSLGHGTGLDTGASIDHPGVKVPSLSPITIASFITAFGAFGLIALGLFDTTARTSLIWAAIGGLIIAIIAHFAFGYFLIAPQGSSEVRLEELSGSEAEVITPIAADSVGEIAFVAQGGRVTYTAKSVDNRPISRGTTVIIEKIVGGVARVRVKELETPEHYLEGED